MTMIDRLTRAFMYHELPTLVESFLGYLPVIPRGAFTVDPFAPHQSTRRTMHPRCKNWYRGHEFPSEFPRQQQA